MSKEHGDIYSSRKFRPTLQEEAEQPATGSWENELDPGRRSNVIFGITIFIFATLIGLVVYQQYQLRLKVYTERQRTSRRLSIPNKNPAKLASLDPMYSILADEILSQDIKDIPSGGDLPLNAQWVKQTAHHLVLAEKSIQEGLQEDALDHYNEALTIFPDLLNVREAVGLIYLSQKDYKKAIDVFNIAATENVMSFSIANNLGVAHLALEQNEEAELNLLDAVKLKPDYPLAHFNLATLYERKSEYRKAAAYYKNYLELKPDNLVAAQMYASVLLKLNQWDDAVSILERVTKASPDVAPTYFSLAEAHIGRSETVPALRSLQRGVSLLDSKNALAWLSRKEFDPMREVPDFQRLVDSLAASD